jgi:hypothetical protein
MVLTFAFTATVINYLDCQPLAVLAPVLLQRYNISAASYSRIISTFMLAYTVQRVLGPAAGSSRCQGRLGGMLFSLITS